MLTVILCGLLSRLLGIYHTCVIFLRRGGEIRVLRKPGEKRKEGELLNIYPSS